MTTLEKALALQAGLKAWIDADVYLREGVPCRHRISKLRKVFRDNWDSRIGADKFGGVWSIGKAKTNLRHPASKAALDAITDATGHTDRSRWSGSNAGGVKVTVEHAIPISVLFDHFWRAETADEMQKVIDAYVVAVITDAEERRLRSNYLQQKMPDDWAGLADPLARWNKVGIEVQGLDRLSGLQNVDGPEIQSAVDCTKGDSASHRSQAKRLNRFMIKKDWENRDLWLDCPARGSRFLIEHDRFKAIVAENTNALNTRSWTQGGTYSWPALPEKLLKEIQPYKKSANMSE